MSNHLHTWGHVIATLQAAECNNGDIGAAERAKTQNSRERDEKGRLGLIKARKDGVQMTDPAKGTGLSVVSISGSPPRFRLIKTGHRILSFVDDALQGKTGNPDSGRGS